MCVLDLVCKTSKVIHDNVYTEGAHKIVSAHWNQLKAVDSKTNGAKY